MIAQGEGALRLLAPSGYVEDGSVDAQADWVTSFRRKTGCRVMLSTAASAGGLISQFKAGQGGAYDGVLAPPQVAGQLIAGRDVAPVNVRLVNGYTSLSAELRSLPGLRSGGNVYGIPYAWASYVLGYNTSRVKPAPRGWGAIFDPASAARNAGKITLPDSPLTIALAALYLKSAQPSLGISNPYELTQPQFDAAVRVLTGVRDDVSSFWSRDADAIGALGDGLDVLGAVAPHQVDDLMRAGRPAGSVSPATGVTAYADSWLVSASAPDPYCMYQWLSWSINPGVQEQVSVWTGLAPANPEVCARRDHRSCAVYHVADPAYMDKVAFAQLPVAQCGDARRSCVGYPQWQTAWSTIVSG